MIKRKILISQDIPIYLMGDHHGAYGRLAKTIEKLDLSGCVILHVGDGAEGYSGVDEDFFAKVNQYMAHRGINYLSIRGNHSNPACFNGQIDFSNFKLLPDYSRIVRYDETKKEENENWLLVGGATSIDRTFNIEGKSWWPDEKFVLDPKLIGDEKVDVLVTHSAPSWIGPKDCVGLVKTCVDREKILGRETLWGELVEERAAHDELINLTKPNKFFCGHFHCSVQKTFQGEGFETFGRILSENELLKYGEKLGNY